MLIALNTPMFGHTQPQRSEPAGESRYQRLVGALVGAERLQQERFVTIALAELAQVYFAEADLAQGAETPVSASSVAWASAVEDYAYRLVAILDTLDALDTLDTLDKHADTAILSPAAAEPGAVPMVVLPDAQVMLEHPRPGQQHAFERALLTAFCQQENCLKLLADAPDSSDPIPIEAQPLGIDWSFSTSGPVCSHRGLALSFPYGERSASMRDLCRGFLAEAESLRLELRWQQREGVDIDWEALELRAQPLASEHILRLNRAGDVALIALPLLAARQELLPALHEWLVRGQERSLVLDARKLGW